MRTQEEFITRSFPNSRKTVKVEELLNWANHQLQREDTYAQKEGFKAGICVTIENVLHATGNYKGFTPLKPNAKVGSVGYYTRVYSTK